MKRLIGSLFALGMVAASASAAAQSYGSYGDRYGDRYGSDAGYGSGNPGGSYYDYAQVVRVDPVFDAGYRSQPVQATRCYETTTAAAGYGGGYGGYGGNGYGGYGGYLRYDGYGRDDGYRPYGDNAGRSMATIAGGVIGAVLGSRIGGGSGQIAATAVGSMVGGIAGRQIYDQSQRNRAPRTATVRVCDPEPVRDGYGGYRGDSGVRAYDVTYEYNGRRYTRRMDYNPGDRIRVRVEVMPQ
ncbi:glycine zipper 2TM domain-containing protein [Thermomonas sp.]|jgi:uncharacterized protein YcfJ|uniref:glycine zipper 2TM domain-containing protein n=1 Tax=Thermomonas sp. TaxID=1971895 RepID=UPI001AC3D65C|nr:glycine zipper 2TM domain-containing protein [Xanthomonadales bacterium]MBN8794555.1 glycine zipper 2TM domain-containing protein [Stenotrophomonas nitritireducens]